MLRSLASVNSTLVGESVAQGQTIFQISYNRFIEIITAPLNYPDMFWILVPLLLILLLMEFYFSRYTWKKFGWDSAYGNSLVMIFVAVDLIRHMSSHGLLFGDFTYKHVIIAVVVLEGLILSFVNFYHLLPEDLALGVSAYLPINFIAAAAIILVYTDIPFDLITLGGFIFLLAALSGLIMLVRLLEPPALDNDEA